MVPGEWYPAVRHAHIALAVASIGFFALRAAGSFAGHAWPLARAPRIASVAIDSSLLAAGVALGWMLGPGIAGGGWLAAKLALLAAYIVAGSFALKRARTRGGRALALVLACAFVASIVAIARTRDPWAPLRAIGIG